MLGRKKERGEGEGGKFQHKLSRAQYSRTRRKRLHCRLAVSYISTSRPRTHRISTKVHLTDTFPLIIKFVRMPLFFSLIKCERDFFSSNPKKTKLGLFLVAPREFNPLTLLVNSQLGCLLPVGILSLAIFTSVICVKHLFSPGSLCVIRY